MKTMTCRQLAGACDEEFHANTFGEMVEMSQRHGMEMAEKGDKQHIEVMEEMRKGMNDPKAMQEMFERIQKEFAALPEDK